MEIRIKAFDNGNPWDFGKTSADYAKYRDIYPKAFYDKLVELNIGTAGQSVLDLGTGTGVLPRNMYKYGAKWTGSDISENQIKYARELTSEAGQKIDYIVSATEELDFASETFDVVTACQCFMYFDTNIIIPKIHKWLKKDGHLAILFMSWVTAESPIAQGSEKLVLKYNPDWNGANMNRHELKDPDWAGEYFTVANKIGFDVPVTFTRESWNGRIKACRGIGASKLTPEQIAEWEKEHVAFLQGVPEVFDILHYVTILDLKKHEF